VKPDNSAEGLAVAMFLALAVVLLGLVLSAPWWLL
jgi:hypothetical protein